MTCIYEGLTNKGALRSLIGLEGVRDTGKPRERERDGERQREIDKERKERESGQASH